MAMELLQAGGVIAFPRSCLMVSTARAGAQHKHGQCPVLRISAQKFMRGVQVRQGMSVREIRASRSGSVVVVTAARRPVQGRCSTFF